MSDITTILMMLLTIYGLAAAVFLLARALEHDFERDRADCTEFDAAAYETRHAALRFRNSVARLLSPLL